MSEKKLQIDRNLIDAELFSREQGPPHALFDLWRSEDPVHWNPPNPAYQAPLPDSPLTQGFWVLTRYDDVYNVSRDQDLFTSHDHGFVIWDTTGPMLALQRENFMGMKPERHESVRRILIPPFKPKAIQPLESRLEQVAERLVDEYSAQGSCEFVFDIASKLPIYGFCEIMGIPDSYRARVVELGNVLADVENYSSLDYDPYQAIFAIAEELSEVKRAQPDGLLLSEMVNDSELGLTQTEINIFFQVFAIAGHETTRSTAAHFIRLMEEYPEQKAILLSDLDAHLPNAIEEVLRFTSTTTNFCRRATRDTILGGKAIAKGDKVYLSYPAANRDPKVFEDPHRFDITRGSARRHLAFGTGPHVCVGAYLARLQLKYLLENIYRKIPDIHLDAEPTWLKSIWFNAIVDMPVKFTAPAVVDEQQR